MINSTAKKSVISLRCLLPLGACLVSLLQPACTVIHGDETEGSYTYASLGGDAKELVQNAHGVSVASVDNSTSFRAATDAAKKAVYAWQAAAAVKSLASTWGKVTNAKTVAGVSKTQATEATKQTQIQADAATRQAEISAQTEQAALGAGQ